MGVGDYHFRPGLWPTIAVIVLLPLLVSLGFWQLDRAEQKQALLDLQKARLAEQSVRLTSDAEDPDALRYREVLVSGVYDTEHQFLVDNQVYRGQPGFYVMTPLKLKGGGAVLVNRGWVPATRERTADAELSVDTKRVDIRGRVDRFPSVGLRLEGAEIPTKGWPAVVQVVDEKVLSEVLGYPLLPYQVALAEDLPGGFVRQWRITKVFKPERHLGYAFQWFALAATLAVIYLWRSLKR